MRIYRETYNDRNGQRQTARRWYIDFRDHLGVRHKLPGFTDKRSSQALLDNILALVSAKISGQRLTPPMEQWLESLPESLLSRLVCWGLLEGHRAEGNKPLIEHIEDYFRSLIHQGDTEQHARQTTTRIKSVMEGCGFIYWTEVSASSIQHHITTALCRTVRKKNAKGQLETVELGPVSKATQNYYLTACKSFARWMIKDRRATTNPLEYLSPAKVLSSDRKIKRRALTAEEVRVLLHATAVAGPSFGIEGVDRMVLYRFAIETGLRASEIRSLKVQDFDLDAGTVTVSDAYSKNRKASTIPLRAEMVKLLSDYLVVKLPTTQAFPMPNESNIPRMLRKDMRQARQQWIVEYPARSDHPFLKIETSEGRIDFHALRHTCASFLVHAGVDPKTCQELMRHSTVELTLGKYSHVYRGKTSEAVAKLPDFGRKNSSEQIKTGTDDQPVDETIRSAFCSDKLCGSNQKKPETTRDDPDTQDIQKSLFPPQKTHTFPKKATGPGRTRTFDQRIMSPPL